MEKPAVLALFKGDIIDFVNPKIKIAVVAIIVIAVAASIGYWYWQKSRKAAPAPTATEALKEVESAAPEVGVPASPVENKIPSLNPVEEANPFKYENPLR